MPERAPRRAKIWAGSTQKRSRKFTVLGVSGHTKRHEVRILVAAKAARHTQRIKEDVHV